MTRNTTVMDKNKKLTQLADDMLKKADQADALKKLGEENPEQASKIQNILSAFGPVESVIKRKHNIDKFEKLLSLISNNIKNSKGYNNFSESEYKVDKKKVFDIKHRAISVDNVSKDDLKLINKIYKKHLNIQSILSGK